MPPPPQTVSRALLEWGGYLMELVDGLCLASFADAGAAVGWALSAQADLMDQVRCLQARGKQQTEGMKLRPLRCLFWWMLGIHFLLSHAQHP